MSRARQASILAALTAQEGSGCSSALQGADSVQQGACTHSHTHHWQFRIRAEKMREVPPWGRVWKPSLKRGLGLLLSNTVSIELFSLPCCESSPQNPDDLATFQGQPFCQFGQVQESSLSSIWMKMMVQLWKLPQQKEQCINSAVAGRSAASPSFPRNQRFPAADSSPERREKKWAACRAGFFTMAETQRQQIRLPNPQSLLLPISRSAPIQ